MHALRAPGDALQPIEDVLARVEARLGEAPVHGVARPLVRPEWPAGVDFTGTGLQFAAHMLSLEDFGAAELNWPRTWRPATDLVNGSAIDDLLAAACRRWPSNPHVAAALAWKSYTYWVTLPTVIGYIAERVVPDVRPDNVEFQIHEAAPFVSIRLIRPDVTSLVGDTSLLAELRKGLLDEHLDPMLEQFRTRVRLGRRTLLGSLASAVCYAVVRARDALPAHAVSDAHHILDALGVADLVDLGPDESGELRVQRHTCCLAFALPTPKICSGCVLPRA